MMKTIISILMLCLPLMAWSKSYNYNNRVTTTRGNDYFLFDDTECTNISGGKIELKENLLILDGKEYPLKPRKKEHFYKSKNCSFQFVYKNGNLAAIKRIGYDTVTSYYIGKDND